MQQLSLLDPNQSEPLLETPQGIDDKNIVILLDLNYTLVSNSHLKKQMRAPYATKIDAEAYRQWLVELVRGHTVCLCTVRYVGYEAQTLARIEARTGWKPDHAFFNPLEDVWQGDKVKEPYLVNSIIPIFGAPSERNYLGIESAWATRAMYKRHGIFSAPVPKDGQWSRLPFPDAWGL